MGNPTPAMEQLILENTGINSDWGNFGATTLISPHSYAAIRELDRRNEAAT
jgi:hypothetical protein